nr:microtubule-associated serine/threonine-protein kinase 4 [Leptinotarsa decemlineata]
MSENLERLLTESREKSEDAANLMMSFIKKLLLIISRPARLLECLEFDPEEFYHFLEAAEGQVKGVQGIKADIPQYIIQKLGLNRDPIAELQQELKECAWSNENAKSVSVNTAPTVRKSLTNPSENDFEVVKLISNGAYGVVNLVKHKHTKLRFAMKKINKNNLMLRNQVEQVFAERDILSFADNPFVVSMYCSFETKKHLCLVMEYVEGGDCASLLKNIGPLPADMARFYFAETVLAVEYLHSYGIVHRDLKPDNLLITALGHIKLTDFGLSKVGLMSYEIEWPVNEDWPVQEEAKDLITSLLQHSPRDRLGTGGAHEIKEHVYFYGIDWNSLLRKKAEFIPQLEHDEDTSYFDSRIDRYSHELEDDTDDTDDSPVFGLFSSCSPQYKKVSELSSLSTDTDLDSSALSLKTNTSDSSVPDVINTVDSKPKLKLSDNLRPRTTEKKKTAENKLVSLDLSCTKSTPESSQTDSDDVSPQVNRRKKPGHGRDFLPKFSISVEDEHCAGSSLTETREFPLLRQFKTSNLVNHSSRSVVRSASTSGLSLMIPADDLAGSTHLIHSPSAGGGSSTASSRDTSPCRELSPLGTSLKPPIIIRRGPKGFGFTVHTIRVYYGDTDVYTMHHLVMAVDEGSPAFEAGLRPADLITHINGETVQGLYHTQVLQLLLSGAEHVSLRATPLEQTSIKTGGRKREPSQSKLARRSLNRQKKQKRESDKRRKTSLFKRISSKRASAEMQQALHASGPTCSPAVPNRRKSVGHIPLSPLARTPSPSPLPASPTRSPSPLAFPIGHQPGSSNTTQTYSPSAGSAPIAIIAQPKKGFARPKAGEPGSPLLRRALSPDRLHPRSAENKCSISPLCSSSGTTCGPNMKCQARVGGASSVWHPNTQQEREKDTDSDSSQSSDLGPGELLPRIAEEKDSPTNGHDAKLKKIGSNQDEQKNIEVQDRKNILGCVVKAATEKIDDKQPAKDSSVGNNGKLKAMDDKTIKMENCKKKFKHDSTSNKSENDQTSQIDGERNKVDREGKTYEDIVKEKSHRPADNGEETHKTDKNKITKGVESINTSNNDETLGITEGTLKSNENNATKVDVCKTKIDKDKKVARCEETNKVIKEKSKGDETKGKLDKDKINKFEEMSAADKTKIRADDEGKKLKKSEFHS